MDFAGKVAVITGGAGGIGFGLAEIAAGRDASVEKKRRGRVDASPDAARGVRRGKVPRGVLPKAETEARAERRPGPRRQRAETETARGKGVTRRTETRANATRTFFFWFRDDGGGHFFRVGFDLDRPAFLVRPAYARAYRRAAPRRLRRPLPLARVASRGALGDGGVRVDAVFDIDSRERLREPRAHGA